MTTAIGVGTHSHPSPGILVELASQAGSGLLAHAGDITDNSGESESFIDGFLDMRRLMEMAPKQVAQAFTTPYPDVIDLQPETETSLSVGAWVGIGIGVAVVIIAVLYFFVCNKRIRESLVRFLLKREGNLASYDDKLGIAQKPTEPPGGDTLEAGSIKFPRITSPSTFPSEGSTHFSPRILNIPFAPVDIDHEGRMSPRLPIASKQSSSSVAGTPSVTSRI
jgi:hypothetical protein